ncbi:MAG: hypothetical protein L0H94_06185 [Nitrospira sp.]|nr:hypothetical protein [Nitrospira sp.]
MSTESQDGAYRVEGLEEPTFGGYGGDVLTHFSLASVPQNKALGRLTDGFLSAREDRLLRRIRRRQDRSTDRRIGKLLTRLGTKKSQGNKGTA